VFTRLMLIYNK